MLSGGRSPAWRAMKPRTPSCSVSSAPHDTSHTSSPSTGSSRSISASATIRRAGREVVVGARHGLAARDVGHQRDAQGDERQTGHLRPAPAGGRAGQHQGRGAGGQPPLGRRRLDVLDQPRRHLPHLLLQRSGRRRARSGRRRGGPAPPACAQPAGSPARATTLTVRRSRRTRRRTTRGPFCASSKTPATERSESAAPSLRRPARPSRPPSTPTAASPAEVGANVPQLGSSSSSTSRQPAARKRSASHSAARRSPGEQGVRSSGASASTTSRSVAAGTSATSA